jgi:hypothetical protein
MRNYLILESWNNEWPPWPDRDVAEDETRGARFVLQQNGFPIIYDLVPESRPSQPHCLHLIRQQWLRGVCILAFQTSDFRFARRDSVFVISKVFR